MQPVIKDMSSPDVDNVELFEPETADVFGFLLEVEIGLQNEIGSDIFGFVVCSPKWFEMKILKQNEAVNGRHYLFMKKYDYQSLKQYLNQIIKNSEGRDWSECSLRLSRYGHWEYEDYKES